MTKLGGIGCTLIGLGPCVVLFIATVARNPLKIIVMTASGFFWLLSLLVASIFWFAISHLTSHLAPSLIIAVVTQEAMRFAFYKLIVKADEGLHLITANMRATPPTLQVADSRRLSPASGGGDRNSFEFAIPVNRRSSDLLRPVQGGLGGILSHQIVAYVAGLGFGVMSCVVELLRLLHESYGPGIHFDNLESKFFFVVAAFQAMCLSMMQIFWSLVLFAAFEMRAYVQLISVYVVHLAISCLSLLNTFPSPWPEFVCAVYFVTLIGMIVLTSFLLRKRNGAIRTLQQRAAQTAGGAN
ncbi:unnamed protein product [Calicophoron daubneyi]|uniref:Uncharacterized protein n=1 Tax=Calicophoron daubneyi TaxID=300641 RepID=A0AAV2TPV6_CALDB